jgi:tRNA A58 N-methylase Trm61
MRTYQRTVFTVLAKYGILYGGHIIDAGVGSGRRRRFLDLYGFRFSATL